MDMTEDAAVPWYIETPAFVADLSDPYAAESGRAFSEVVSGSPGYVFVKLDAYVYCYADFVRDVVRSARVARGLSADDGSRMDPRVLSADVVAPELVGDMLRAVGENRYGRGTQAFPVCGVLVDVERAIDRKLVMRLPANAREQAIADAGYDLWNGTWGKVDPPGVSSGAWRADDAGLGPRQDADEPPDEAYDYVDSLAAGPERWDPGLDDGAPAADADVAAAGQVEAEQVGADGPEGHEEAGLDSPMTGRQASWVSSLVACGVIAKAEVDALGKRPSAYGAERLLSAHGSAAALLATDAGWGCMLEVMAEHPEMGPEQAAPVALWALAHADEGGRPADVSVLLTQAEALRAGGRVVDLLDGMPGRDGGAPLFPASACEGIDGALLAEVAPESAHYRVDMGSIDSMSAFVDACEGLDLDGLDPVSSWCFCRRYGILAAHDPMPEALHGLGPTALAERVGESSRSLSELCALLDERLTGLGVRDLAVANDRPALDPAPAASDVLSLAAAHATAKMAVARRPGALHV